MKLMELIAKLETLSKSHGDLEVKVWLPGSTISLGPSVFSRSHAGAYFIAIEGNLDPGSALLDLVENGD